MKRTHGKFPPRMARLVVLFKPDALQLPFFRYQNEKIYSALYFREGYHGIITEASRSDPINRCR